ncbi:unnamed protein product [Cylindrotheca closterium]|uniref:Calmodulin-lysine N-methyltransferase n=1 Tax=Cylindrotheca closterium TaxID=2856 RepID=A0AAD2JJA3_9STRA|nr:unnamed protein product [Cylindrotheca closterium]
MSKQEQSDSRDDKPPTLSQHHKETKWYDAWIRWEKGSKENYDDDDEDEEEDEEPPLIPTDTYHSSYQVPSQNDDATPIINLELMGFPSESEAIWTSTGLTLWQSSEFLCDYLVEHYGEIGRLRHGDDDDNDTDKPCRILEVGSGLGRSGILMHLLANASSYQEQEQQEQKNDDSRVFRQQVVLTDGDTDVLAQLRSNVQHNLELNAKLVQNNNASDLSCHQLIWGKDHAKAFVNRPCFHHSMNHHNNTNDPNASYHFDVIIGSDLIYVTQVIQPLFETVQTLLHPKHGIFLMAHCARREGNEVDLDVVFDQARKVGLQYTQLHPEDDDKTTNCENDQEEGIYLYQFEWSRRE